ncbi:hypothetical protein [Streptomyces sp. NPDC020917]|uniref:hypothetical protein n=1 Tax=Streptomyces sp. NPDC020917 TaxID=3365102 RepID=UPI003791968F
MTEKTRETAGIHAEYAAKVTADLERNTQEQARIAAEAAALEEQLRLLRRDHELLMNVQQALRDGAETVQATQIENDTVAAPEPEHKPEATAVPKPRRSSATKAPTRRRKTSVATSTATKGRSAKGGSVKAGSVKAGSAKELSAKAEPANTEPAKAESSQTGSPKAGSPKAGKSAKPTLVSLVRDYLATQSEPKSATEISGNLVASHPDRSIKATVVRTTVEALVAKGHAYRSKQGTSVFYEAAGA